MRARLAMIAAVGGLALAGVPEALADPIPVAPDEGASYTARVGQIAFQASTAIVPPPAQINFYVSRNNDLSNGIDTLFAGPINDPPIYEAGPDSDRNWPNKPGTYYWRARYDDCAVADPNCFSPIRSLTIEPLAPPAQTSPADDATIPYGAEATFSAQDVPSYRRRETRIYLEFSKNSVPRPNGRLADRYLAEPHSVGEGAYEYRLTRRITESPGTYYWIVERFDCSAEADCYVTDDDEIRSFTVAPPPAGTAPNTFFTHHPPRRTHRRRARFAFSSNLPGASFQCFYTGGWSPCRSPQRFRHLKPGRYRFKVRAVANGKRDPTPASWLFRVLRRHRNRH